MELNIDDFDLSEEDAEESAKTLAEFIANQEEIPASSECEGGGCIL